MEGLSMDREKKKRKKMEKFKSIARKVDSFIKINNNARAHLEEQERLLRILYEDYTILKNKENKVDIRPFERKMKKMNEQFLELKNLYSKKKESLERELGRPLLHHKSIF